MASHLVSFFLLIGLQSHSLFLSFQGKHFWYRAGSCKLFILLQSMWVSSRQLSTLLKITLLPTQIGACRHGDRCSRKHIKPPFSQTILLPNVYHNPAHDPVCKLTEKELQEGFDAIYEDLYCELSKFGHLLELHVRAQSFVFQINH